jgi:hypothetical protein
MAKCDPCDFEAAFGELWCNRCLTEFVRAEDDLPAYACRGCNLQHIEKNMIDKLEGRYCRWCAAKYEEELLRKLITQ